MAGKSNKSRQAQQPARKLPRTPTQSVQPWRQGVLLPAFGSAIGMWAAFPPLGWAPLAWLAPLGWLLIADREMPVGWRGYRGLWLAGCVFWLLVLHGIRLAYWPLHFGWLALSLYLAVYVPVFVGATRILRWHWRWPLVFAAPVAWLGLESIRGCLFTGYAANTLAHSQVHYPLIIQIADQLGGGGISLVMLTVTAAVLRLLQSLRAKQLRSSLLSVAWAAIVCAITICYGEWRLDETDRLAASSRPLLRVLLVQENTPSVFDNFSPERNQQAWESYLELTRHAAAEHTPVDLVVWPESTFTANEPWVEDNLADGLPADGGDQQFDSERLRSWIQYAQQAFAFKTLQILSAAASAEPTRPYLLLGSDALIYQPETVERYNAALFVGPDGSLIDRYDKMHLVMFGEYIPLGSLLQWLRDWVGLALVNPGREVKCFQAGEVWIAPSICFESMMPRLIAWQVRKLAAEGKPPEVLINITNDSWFRGSSMLDHHLACSMLCAVENRRPLLVAANTGLTAQIDGSGRLLQCSERMQAAALLAEPLADGRWGLVQSLGYPFSWLAACVTALAAFLAIFSRKTRQAPIP